MNEFATELAALLWRATLFGSLGMLLVLALRPVLRRWAGMAAAYQGWLIVPCVSLAAMMPSAATPVLRLAPVFKPVSTLAAAPASALVDPAHGYAWLLLWACGMVVMASRFVGAHRAFLRQAGALHCSGGLYFSAGGAGPASVGLLRPRIVVPADFTQRYAAMEQTLILAHEQVHIDRRDALANLLAAVLQCLFWFNPLCHLAVRRFRQDQEIACDALVMARHPRRQRAYAHALLKFHPAGAVSAAAIDCHWQFPHPTKERLMSLQLPAPGSTRRLAGRCAVAVLLMGAMAATVGARAGQQAGAPVYTIAMNFDAGGEHGEPRLLAKAGETFAVASGEWRFEFAARPGQSDGTVALAGKLIKNGKVIASPTLLTRLGDKAGVRAGEGGDQIALSMVVAQQP